jgi:hypothetical protein
MAQEWESAQKELNGALRKGGTPWRSVSQTALFGDLSTYVSVTPIEKFAQFDDPSPLIKAIGQEGSAQLLGRLSKCAVETHRYAMRFRDDLSMVKETGGPLAPLSVITFVRVAPGKRMDYEKLIKTDILPAMKKLDLDGYYVYETILGGNSNDWVSVTPMKKFAELDGGVPIVRALGQSGADKVAMKSGSIITSLERIVSRNRTELSYAPAAK